VVTLGTMGAGPSALQRKLERERRLRELTTRIHSLPFEDLLVKIRADVQRLLDCERVSVYAMDAARNELFAREADGRETRLPVAVTTLAGYVAVKRRGVNLSNVQEAQQLDPNLRPDPGVRQAMAVPVLRERTLYGVLVAANTREADAFGEHDQEVIAHLAETLAVAFQNQERMSIRSSPHDYLLRAKLVSQEQLDQAAAAAAQEGKSVEHVLATRWRVPRAEIARSLAEYFRCEVVFFSPALEAPRELVAKFSVDYMKHHMFVPLRAEGATAVVVMANPRVLTLCDDISRRLGGARLVTCVATREDILSLIDHFAAARPEAAPAAPARSLDAIVQEIEQQQAGARPEAAVEEPQRADDEGMVLLVNQLIERSVDAGASDIHVEPELDGEVVVRVRVDGACHEHVRFPRAFGRSLIARVKIMAGLDIAEHRLPQDGKIRFRDHGSRDIELRVATVPTTGGTEDCVLRVLAASKPRALEELGMLPENLARFRRALEEPYGIVLCVGPTGSGKTTTLHSALGHLNKPDVKIWTAEDPVEITQKGLRQVQVQSKIGLTFERALRSFLRLDPDIIMIGEMRDLETAAAAIEASLTGHLVFSTLHTNNAPETMTRMLDMGLDPFTFGDAMVAVLAQRLVRTACSACRTLAAPTEEQWSQVRREYGDDGAFDALGLEREKTQFATLKGCDRCAGTGYRGRAGLHELLVVDEEIRQLIYRKSLSTEIRAAARRAGMITLKQDGLRKVLQGRTDLTEVRSVCVK